MNRRLLLCGCQTRAYDPEKRLVRTKIMSDRVARDGLRILPDGWRNRDEYMANPVVFLNHDWRHIVANTLAFELEPDGITMESRLARTRTATEELAPLLEDDMIHTASISWDTVRTEEREGVVTITEWDLYEWSFVTLPADPGAVIEHARARGLDWVVAALTPSPSHGGRGGRGEGAVDETTHHAADGTLEHEALIAATYAALTGARGAAQDPALREHLRAHYQELHLSYPSPDPSPESHWPNDEKRAFETRDVTDRLTAAAQRLTGARDILRHWTRENHAVPETVVTALCEVRTAAEALLRAPVAERELQRLYAALGTTDPQTVRGLVDAIVRACRN